MESTAWVVLLAGTPAHSAASHDQVAEISVVPHCLHVVQSNRNMSVECVADLTISLVMVT